MALETASFISELVATNPASGDPLGQGDDHIRMLKTVLKSTFPDAAAAIRTIAGTFTPGITFATPGNLSVTYAANGRLGRHSRLGNRVFYELAVVASSITHTTAAGELLITSLPFATGGDIDHAEVFSVGMGTASIGAGTALVLAQAQHGNSTLVIGSYATGGFAPLDVSDIPSGSALLIALQGSYVVD